MRGSKTERARARVNEEESERGIFKEREREREREERERERGESVNEEGTFLWLLLTLLVWLGYKSRKVSKNKMITWYRMC